MKYIGKGKLVRKGTAKGKLIGKGRFTKKQPNKRGRGNRYA